MGNIRVTDPVIPPDYFGKLKEHRGGENHKITLEANAIPQSLFLLS